MKKGICVVLSTVLLLALAGCGNAAAQAGKKGTPGETETWAESSRENELAEPESLAVAASAAGAEQEPELKNKTLVAYFSPTGTTRLLAEEAAEMLGADLYQIVPENPYTDADLAYYNGSRADREQDDPNARPAISGSVENMEEYETILLGYPKMEYGFNCV